LHNKQGCKQELSNNHKSTKQQGHYFPMTEKQENKCLAWDQQQVEQPQERKL